MTDFPPLPPPSGEPAMVTPHIDLVTHYGSKVAYLGPSIYTAMVKVETRDGTKLDVLVADLTPESAALLP